LAVRRALNLGVKMNRMEFADMESKCRACTGTLGRKMRCVNPDLFAKALAGINIP